MSLLPHWLDTTDPEARKGTTRVRSVEPLWIVGRNRATGDYEVWGPQFKRGGWDVVCILVDGFGRPQRPPHLDWDGFLVAQVNARRDWERGISPVDRVQEHNRKLSESRDRDLRGDQNAKARYVHAALVQEMDGTLRHGADDVFQGLRNADEGRSRGPAQGLKVFAPGA